MQRRIALFLLFFGSFSHCMGADADRVPLAYAQNFTLEHADTYSRLTVKVDGRSASYALVPRKAKLPDLPADLPLIRTPVERVVIMETVYIGYLEAIGKLDRIVGAASLDFVSHPAVLQAVEAGHVEPVQTGQSIDIERLMLLQPDLILTSISADPAFDVPPKLLRSGLPVVLTAGYREPHPLARAEWVRFIAAFFEASAEAEAFFSERVQRYEALQNKTASIENKPTVFAGAPYSGTWHVAGGRSFTARAIQDAGGNYLWADETRRNAIPLDTERVFLKAAEADIWLHPNNYRSLAELIGADPRFAKFAAAQTGRVFNNTRQVADNGGNAIWERGVVYPDVVLADLIDIFHPGLIPEHEPVYYEPLR